MAPRGKKSVGKASGTTKKAAKKTGATKRPATSAKKKSPFKVIANIKRSGSSKLMEGDGPHAMVINTPVKRIVAKKDNKGNIVLDIETTDEL